MDFIDYRRELGIGFDDGELEKIFFTRLFNILDDLEDMYNMDNQISDDEYFDFCMKTGSPVQRNVTTIDEGWYLVMDILHSKSQTIREFLPYYIYFIQCQKDKEYKAMTKEDFKNLVCNCLKDTHIPFDIFKENDNFFIFPKGAKELDTALVSTPLLWLEDYPKSRKTYIIALKQYSDGIYIRDTADNLRKALETFLQEFLSNKKNLETNKKEIYEYLGKQGVDGIFSGLFQALINSYKNINDSMVKHNDKIDEKLLELLLYQTGVLIRMVISVKNMEKHE